MSKISIQSDDHVFVLTGAGISAESGLPTFRASDGLWAGNRVEDVCTPEAWQRNPWRVWEVYAARARRDALAAVAKLALEIRNIAMEYPDAVCTMGSVKTFPE